MYHKGSRDRLELKNSVKTKLAIGGGAGVLGLLVGLLIGGAIASGENYVPARPALPFTLMAVMTFQCH